MTRALKLEVASVSSECSIWIEEGLLGTLSKVIDVRKFSNVVIVGDGGASQWAELAMATIGVPPESLLLIEGGESIKSVEGLTKVWSFFASANIDRRSLIVAVGGGATTDLVGFAAATYMRGVTFITVPTTLLAQVDASVGGKSGINFAGVKNLVGSIKQPHGVVIDVATLATLTARDLRSGFAEIVKHGAIADRSYFEHATSRPCTQWSGSELSDLIFRSCEIKRGVVEADETEQGPRKILNFGHTIAHAIEAVAAKTSVSVTHGEAVAIGMCAESFLSYKTGRITLGDHQLVTQAIARTGLPTVLPAPMDSNDLRTSISRDKKNVGGAIKWSLLGRVGEAVYNAAVPEGAIAEALATIQPQ